MPSHLSRVSVAAALLGIVSLSSLVAQVPDDPFSDENDLPDGVMLLGAVKGDSIVLRWGPTTPATWMAGNTYGYIVERQEYTAGPRDSVSSTTTLLTPEPLLPWSEQRWLERIGSDTTRRWLMIAQHVLFNETSPEEMGSAGGSFGALRMNTVELQNRHGFALFAADNDPEAAEGLGFRFVDHAIDTQAIYMYRVYVAIPPGDSVVAGYTIGYSDLLYPGLPASAPEPYGVAAIGGEGEITLSWEEQDGGGFSGYWIERLESDGSWRTLNEDPIVYVGYRPESVDQLTPSDTGMVVDGSLTPPRMLNFVDSTIVNYRTYQYRVRGRDPFGDLSQGVVVEAMGRDLTPPGRPSDVASKEVGPGAVELSWEMHEVSGDLAGFVVHRGPTVDGPFRIITETPVPATARSYNVFDANESEPYYYVASIDTAGNAAASLTFLGAAIDRVPPSQPTGLAGRVDTNGVITITWSPGPEEDLLGYRVYFANDSTDEFALIHDGLMADTVYVDSLRIQTASNEIFYRVKAYDTRRAQSPMSEILTVMQPDLIRPNARAFGEITPTDSSVILRWHRGRARDVVEQIVLRREFEAEGEWQEVVRLDGEAEIFEDTTTDRKATYNYTIVAVDNAGLVSDTALPVYTGSYDRVAVTGVSELNGRLDREAGTIELRWSYDPPTDQNPTRLVVYRAPLHGDYERHTELAPTARSYTAPDAWDQPTWKYAVVVETEEGASVLRDGVIVVVN